MALVRMDIGEATFLDVIEAQATKINARQGLISNVIEYNCAQAKLLFDSGTITASDIIQHYTDDEHNMQSQMPAKDAPLENP